MVGDLVCLVSFGLHLGHAEDSGFFFRKRKKKSKSENKIFQVNSVSGDNGTPFFFFFFLRLWLFRVALHELNSGLWEFSRYKGHLKSESNYRKVWSAYQNPRSKPYSASDYKWNTVHSLVSSICCEQPRKVWIL